MNQSNLKNMVVLKNLPSNIVEEAIIILKANKKVKKLEKIEKNKVMEDTRNKMKENDYILKEAEMLVSNYISGLEEKKETKKIKNQKMNLKYRRIKNYAYVASFIILIETMILFIK
jgi:predicted transcriptional regulator